MENKLVSDTTFKYLFKNKKTKEWFIELIKFYTNIDLSNYTLVDTELNSGDKKIKDYKTDLKLESGMHTVIIEMQNDGHKVSDIKNYQYLFRTAGSKYEKGDNYVVSKTSLICFNNYKKKYANDLLPIHHQLQDPKHNVVKGFIESFEFFIPNYHIMDYNECDEMQKRLWLLGCIDFKEIDNNKLLEKDKALIKELEVLNMDPKFQEEYAQELAHKKLMNSIALEEFELGVEQGIERGIEQGKQVQKIDIIFNLLKMNMSLEDISKAVDMSIEEIETIINKETK